MVFYNNQDGKQTIAGGYEHFDYPRIVSCGIPFQPNSFTSYLGQNAENLSCILGQNAQFNNDAIGERLTTLSIHNPKFANRVSHQPYIYSDSIGYI